MPKAFQGQKIWERLQCRLDKVSTSATDNCSLGISSTQTENLHFSFILEKYGLITTLTTTTTTKNTESFTLIHINIELPFRAISLFPVQLSESE